MSTRRLAHFESDVGRARDIVALGQSIGTLTIGRVDSSDLYRAGLVQAVSALDSYVHGVVLDLAADIILGRSAAVNAGGKVGVSFEAVRQILAAESPGDRELAARSHISQRLSLDTYQRPDDVATALAAVGMPKVWSTVFGTDAGSTKVALGLVVTRRNRIVHQSDSDPLYPGSVTPLIDADSLSAISTVEKIVRAIDAAI